MLISLLVGFALLRPRLPPRKSDHFFYMESFKDPVCTTFVLDLAFAFMPSFVPFFYVESFAQGVDTSEHLSYYILAIMNAAGTLGRIVSKFVADRHVFPYLNEPIDANSNRIGNLNVIIPITYISGRICLLWLTVHKTANILALYSLFSSGFHKLSTRSSRTCFT